MKYRGILTTGLMAGALCGTILSSVASAAPAGIALIDSNAAYTALAPLPACTLSSRAISAALVARGYEIITLVDGSVGQLDGAMNQLTDRLRATPDIPAVIYFCGYVEAQNGRSFLVPASAALERPSDILSQGVLAKDLVDVAARAGARPMLVLLEAATVPDATEQMDLASLDRTDLPPGVGLLGVAVAAGDWSLRLASSLIPLLKPDAVRLADVVTGIRQDTDDMASASVVLAHPPTGTMYLIGGPPLPPPLPPKPLASEPPVTSVELLSSFGYAPEQLLEPAAAPPAPAIVAELQPPPPGAPSEAAEPGFPDEPQMTRAMRRDIQTKLAALGYYAGSVDGVFASNTRAAVRRLQHELQAPMTGHLTGAQASQLMTMR